MFLILVHSWAPIAFLFVIKTMHGQFWEMHFSFSLHILYFISGAENISMCSQFVLTQRTLNVNMMFQSLCWMQCLHATCSLLLALCYDNNPANTGITIFQGHSVAPLTCETFCQA